MLLTSHYHILLSALLCILACSSLQKWQPLDTDLVNVQHHHPDIKIQDLKTGYKLYKEQCSGCHALHHPSEYSITQWDSILPEMFSQAKINNPNEKLFIKQYLYSKTKSQN